LPTSAIWRSLIRPVFHDDQHGTAIVVAAAIYNGLQVVGKNIDEVRLVTSGAGAAALSCLDLLVAMGLKQEHILVTDIAGVVYRGRQEAMDPYKARYAVETDMRTLQEVLPGADIFLGLSAGGVLKPEYLAGMAERPLIMALANPVPEIMPELVKEVRPDAVIGTGRSDFPNQVNNVLCFPFLFRGALDVGATRINETMKMAAVRAIADLAVAGTSDEVRSAYSGQNLRFGSEYLIPKPFDPRLMECVAPAVARAAMESGVAERPIEDLEVEGEMHADLALSEDMRNTRYPGLAYSGAANLLVMPNLDAANISFNMLKVLADGIVIGPLLVGVARSAHIVTPSISVRGLLNMTALAAVRTVLG